MPSRIRLNFAPKSVDERSSIVSKDRQADFGTNFSRVSRDFAVPAWTDGSDSIDLSKEMIPIDIKKENDAAPTHVR